VVCPSRAVPPAARRSDELCACFPDLWGRSGGSPRPRTPTGRTRHGARLRHRRRLTGKPAADASAIAAAAALSHRSMDHSLAPIPEVTSVNGRAGVGSSIAPCRVANAARHLSILASLTRARCRRVRRLLVPAASVTDGAPVFPVGGPTGERIDDCRYPTAQCASSSKQAFISGTTPGDGIRRWRPTCSASVMGSCHRSRADRCRCCTRAAGDPRRRGRRRSCLLVGPSASPGASAEAAKGAASITLTTEARGMLPNFKTFQARFAAAELNAESPRTRAG